MTSDETTFSTVVAVNSTIAANADLISRGQLDLTAAVGATGISVGDGNIANSLAGVFNTDIAFAGSGGITTTTTTIIRYSGQIVQLQSTLANDARSDLDFNETFLETISFRQQSQSGVNIDEELAELVALENAFAASARVFATVAEMLDQLINTVR